MSRLLFGIGTLCYLFLSGPTAMRCDTLYNDKTAVAIGLGTIEKNMIHWTDCSGANKKDYKKPPYWVDKADNCKVNPNSFGLELKNGRYVVADANTLDKFFPGAKVGEEVGFVKSKNEVQLTYGSKTLKLKTQGSRELYDKMPEMQ